MDYEQYDPIDHSHPTPPLLAINDAIQVVECVLIFENGNCRFKANFVLCAIAPVFFLIPLERDW